MAGRVFGQGLQDRVPGRAQSRRRVGRQRAEETSAKAGPAETALPTTIHPEAYTANAKAPATASSPKRRLPESVSPASILSEKMVLKLKRNKKKPEGVRAAGEA